MVVKSSFSQTNFDVSQEFYYDSLGEIFLKLDLIIERFVKINQITVNQLDDIYERRFSIYWIKYFKGNKYEGFICWGSWALVSRILMEYKVEVWLDHKGEISTIPEY